MYQRQRLLLRRRPFRYYATPDAFGKTGSTGGGPAARNRPARSLRLGDHYLSQLYRSGRDHLAHCRMGGNKGIGDVEEQQVLGEHVTALKASGARNVEATGAWRLHLGPEPWHQRVYDAIAETERTVHEIARFVEERYAY